MFKVPKAKFQTDLPVSRHTTLKARQKKVQILQNDWLSKTICSIFHTQVSTQNHFFAFTSELSSHSFLSTNKRRSFDIKFGMQLSLLEYFTFYKCFQKWLDSESYVRRTIDFGLVFCNRNNEMLQILSIFS